MPLLDRGCVHSDRESENGLPLLAVNGENAEIVVHVSCERLSVRRDLKTENANRCTRASFDNAHTDLKLGSER